MHFTRAQWGRTRQGMYSDERFRDCGGIQVPFQPVCRAVSRFARALFQVKQHQQFGAAGIVIPAHQHGGLQLSSAVCFR
jgi:hypothetical protein